MSDTTTKGLTIRPTTYRLWVNDDRTMLVRLWEKGDIEVSTRPNPACTWGPPITLREEEVPGAAA